MIVSHSHRYIHIKTRKTAGTSTSVALALQLNPGDACLRLDTEGRDYKFPKNIFINRYVNVEGRRFRLDAHASIEDIYITFPTTLDYHIITNERNPWDRLVSLFYWEKKIGHCPQEIGFKKYVFEHLPLTFAESELYYAGDIPLFDFIVRHEHLESDLRELGRFLKLPKPLTVQDIHLKGNVRKGAGYHSYYDAETIDYVQAMFARTIQLMGYEFDDPTVSRRPEPLASREHVRPRVAALALNRLMKKRRWKLPQFRLVRPRHA